MNLAIVCLPHMFLDPPSPNLPKKTWVVINPDGGALNPTLSRWSIGWLVFFRHPSEK